MEDAEGDREFPAHRHHLEQRVDALPVVNGHHQVVGVFAPVEGIEVEEVEIHDLDLGVLLRQPAAQAGRAHEADPGMAGPQ